MLQHMYSTILLPPGAQLFSSYCSKVAALRIILNIDGCGVVAPQCTLLLALPFFSPSSFHTISHFPAVTSA
jgi:hypothetical protein